MPVKCCSCGACLTSKGMYTSAWLQLVLKWVRDGAAAVSMLAHSGLGYANCPTHMLRLTSCGR